jgi:hypothetical protein
MIIPTKHENLNKNLMVIGAYIIEILVGQHRTIDDIHVELSKQSGVNFDIEKLFDALTFLYATDLIYVDRGLVRLRL